MPWKILLIVLVALVVLFFIVCFAIGYVLWKSAIPTPDPHTYINAPSKDKTENEFNQWRSKVEKEMSQLNLEEVQIRSFDGLTLHGYFKEAPRKTEKTIICVHGWHGSALRSSAEYSHWLVNYNYNLLFIDLRSYGRSEGKYTTYGVLDTKDLKNWIDYCIAKITNAEIALFGISMGGNTVCNMANSIPDEVKCIIDDCGYTSSYDIMRHMMKMKNVPAFFLPFANCFCKMISKFDLRDNDARAALRSTKVPVLFIHGVKDRFVPTSMSLELHEACGSKAKEIHLFEGVTHAKSYFENKEAYQRIVSTFLAKNL